MALAILLGKGPVELVDVGRKGPKLKPGQVVLIGLRDLDHEEKAQLKESGCSVFTMRDIDELGMHAVLKKTLKILAHCKQLHMSLDMDSIDPNEAPGVGTPVLGGLTYREAQLMMETVHGYRQPAVTRYHGEQTLYSTTATGRAQIAVRLTASLFGKSIY